ncbi:MAG: porin [Pseudomonadota bacterium]
MKFVRSVLAGVIPGVALVYGLPVAAETLEEKLETLDQQVKVLERRLELSTDEATAKAKQNAVVSAGDKGFSIKSADGDYELRLRGYVQSDTRNFLDDDAHALSNTFLVRRARPSFEGTVAKSFDFRIVPDFAGSSVSLIDAYAEVKYWPAATVRVGRFKPALSLLRLQSDTQLTFAERAPVTALTPDRDAGVQVEGGLVGGAVNYALGVFNGAADGASNSGDSADQKDVVARIFLQPWANDPGLLQGLGFGIAGSRGRQTGTSDVGVVYRSTGQQTIFAYNGTGASAVSADGTHTRVVPQFHYYYNNIGIVGEYARSSQDVKSGTSSATLAHKGWDLELNWVVTGEDASYKGIKPKSVFVPGGEGAGAVELGLRVGALDIDDDAFAVYADPAKSVTQARVAGAGVNWYLNSNVRLTLNYERTRFTGGAAGGADKADEKLLLGRLQLAY